MSSPFMRLVNQAQHKKEFENLKMKTAEDYIMMPFYDWVADLRNKTEIQNLSALIVGKTAQGKTHLTAHKMIPKLLKDEGIKVAVVSAPNNGILNVKVFTNAINENFKDGEVKVVTNFTDARNWFMLGKKVVLITIHPQLITHNGGMFIRQMNHFAPNKYAVFIDEAHGWLVPNWDLYKATRGHTATPKSYGAVLYKLLTKCETNYQFWLTATPTNVQIGKVKYTGKLQCEIINELPPKNLTIDRLAYLNSVMYYPTEIRNEWSSNNCKFGHTTIEKLVLKQLKKMRELQSETGIKKTMLIRTGPSNARNMWTSVRDVRRMLDNLVIEAGYDKKETIYGVTNEHGVSLQSVDGTSITVENDIILQEYMDNSNHPVSIMLVIDKCYQGMDVSSIGTVVVWRTSTAEDSNGEPILDFGVQVAGRGSRPFAGDYELTGHTFDSLKHLPSDVKKMITEANGFDLILPDTNQAREVGKVLSDDILSSKEEFIEYFFDVDKKMITPSGKERDAAYKSYKKEVPYCEKHLNRECKSQCRDLPEYKDLTDEEFDLAWWKALQVNHKDGNREDSRKENLETVCPNYHSVETILDKHYLNEYE